MPDAAFAPVLAWFAEEDVPALEMPWRLARLAEARSFGTPDDVRAVAAAAGDCLNRIRARLCPRDLDALDLHPWAHLEAGSS